MTDLLGFQITCEEGGRNLKLSLSVKKKSHLTYKSTCSKLMKCKTFTVAFTCKFFRNIPAKTNESASHNLS